MDPPGEGFLARARLADHQDRQAIARCFRRYRERGAEIGGRTDHFLKRQDGRHFLRQRRQLARRTAAIAVGAERFNQPFRRNRADEEIVCSRAHRIDRAGDRFAPGQHNYRQVGACALQRRDQRRSGIAIPTRQQSRAHFAPVWAFEQVKRAFRHGVGQAPARARRGCGDQPPFGGIAVDQ